MEITGSTPVPAPDFTNIMIFDSLNNILKNMDDNTFMELRVGPNDPWAKVKSFTEMGNGVLVELTYTTPLTNIFGLGQTEYTVNRIYPDIANFIVEYRVVRKQNASNINS